VNFRPGVALLEGSRIVANRLDENASIVMGLWPRFWGFTGFSITVGKGSSY